MSDPPRWRPGWSNPGDVVIYAGRIFQCIARTAGKPTDRAPQWRRLTDAPAAGDGPEAA